MESNTVFNEPLELAVPVGVAVIGALAVLPWLLQDNGKAALAKFPLVGAELGSVEKRRKQYLGHALDVHNEGYSKVSAGPQATINWLISWLRSYQHGARKGF